ncbi:MAG: tetratricopeptide repeat protein [Luteimonas sp.]
MDDFFARMKQRKLVQWLLAYAAFGFALLQGVDIVAQRFGWPEQIERLLILGLALGSCVVLVLAWYHGERGAQRVSGTELAILTLLLAVGGGLAWRFEPAPRPADAKLPVADPAATLPAPAAAPGKIPAESIAVLPLLNESGDASQDYFSDGLSEELISALGQVPGLKVIGRNSSFRFRGEQQADTSGIGARLGVANLLEGTVRKQGDEVRIVASLIRASDGSQLWSQTFDRQLKDVFAMQSAIATSVANALTTTLLGRRIEATDKPPSGSVAAYDAMLQGRFLAERRNRPDYEKAVGFYGKAIGLDPGYALAYARLAIAQQWFNDWAANNHERRLASAQARTNAHKAVQLAPQSALALGALGINQAWSDFDYTAAEATLKQAVAVDPSNAETLYQLADVTCSLGRLDPCIAMMHRALAMEPLNASFHFYIGSFLLAAGRFDEAQSELERAIALQPGADGYGSNLAIALMERGEFDRAIEVARSDPNGQNRRQALAMIWWARGDKGRAKAQVAEQIRLDADNSPGLIATSYAFQGNADQAFLWLDRALQVRDPTAAAIYETPPQVIATLRGDTRFAGFSKRAGLPAPAHPATAPGQ